jgi:hypothetical protein
MGQRWLDGYSADVEVYLLIAGERVDVAQIGHGKLILRTPREFPPGTRATLVFTVDGQEEREEVVLCEGAANVEEPVMYL